MKVFDNCGVFVWALCVDGRDDAGLSYYPQWCYSPPTHPYRSTQPTCLTPSIEREWRLGFAVVFVQIVQRSSHWPEVVPQYPPTDLRLYPNTLPLLLTKLLKWHEVQWHLILVQWWLRALSVTFNISIWSISFGGGGSVQICTAPSCSLCCMLHHGRHGEDTWLPRGVRRGEVHLVRDSHDLMIHSSWFRWLTAATTSYCTVLYTLAL